MADGWRGWAGHWLGGFRLPRAVVYRGRRPAARLVLWLYYSRQPGERADAYQFLAFSAILFTVAAGGMGGVLCNGRRIHNGRYTFAASAGLPTA